MAYDRLISKGGLVRTLSVSDPSIKRKKIVLTASLLDVFLTDGVLLYVGLFLVPSLMYTFLAIVPIMTVAILFTYIFLKSILGKSFYPVTIYSNGIEFPEFLFNRIIKLPSFLKKEDIESAWIQVPIVNPGNVRTNDYQTLSFRTKTNKIYSTGGRSRSDIEMAGEWMEKNWGLIVELRPMPYGNTTPQTPAGHARKVRVVERFCPQCGRKSDGSLLFCPYCGTNFSPEPTQQSPIESTWRASTDQLNNPYVRPNPETPHPQPTYPSQYPPYGDAQMTRPNGKNPRLAFILALVLGFLGFMGIGHLYMGKRLKGVVLLLLGGFLAMLSLVAILMLFEPSEYEIEVRIFTAALLSAPYLGLQLWQAFDAPKPNKRMPRNPY